MMKFLNILSNWKKQAIIVPLLISKQKRNKRIFHVLFLFLSYKKIEILKILSTKHIQKDSNKVKIKRNVVQVIFCSLLFFML